MWSARTKWRVRQGELETAVHLVQGSFTDWEEVKEIASEGSSLFLSQSEKAAPCELTVDFPQTSFFVSLIKVSSTARICEVYSCKLGSQDHEYVCTVRGQEQQPSVQTESNLQAATSNQPEVPLYSCSVKLARGPALTSLRLKFLSLQNKSELKLEPVHLYASKGPASILPPRLMNSSFSGLAPLLPALGPLLGANLPGLPQLPEAFSHLQQLQGVPKSTEAKEQEEGKKNVIDLNQSGVRDRSAMPEGLAQLMQGLLGAGANSHAAVMGIPQPTFAGVNKDTSRQTPPFDLAELMAALSRNRESSAIGSANGLSETFQAGQRQDAQKSQVLEEADTESQTSRPGQNGRDQQATLEKVLERLDGLEHTCLRIERAVMGTLSSFEARLKRLEEQDVANTAETLRNNVVSQEEAGPQEDSTAAVRAPGKIVFGDTNLNGRMTAVEGRQHLQENLAATSNSFPSSEQGGELFPGGGDTSQETLYAEAEAATNL